MANIPESMQASSFTGLGTFSFQCITAGFKNIKGKITLPSPNEGSSAPSQVVVTLNVNGGSAFYTGVAGAEGFESGAAMSSGDVLNVILSSSAPVDQGLNVIKSTIAFY